MLLLGSLRLPTGRDGKLRHANVNLFGEADVLVGEPAPTAGNKPVWRSVGKLEASLSFGSVVIGGVSHDGLIATEASRSCRN